MKDHTVGKAATFTKVDNVIQETKNLMNVISKVVTTCFECATKVGKLKSSLIFSQIIFVVIVLVIISLSNYSCNKYFQCNVPLPKRVRFPCSSLDGRHLPLQLSPQALKRLANLTSSITLPR